MAINLKNCVAADNAGDGLRITGQIDVAVDGFTASRNGGQGISIVSEEAARVMTELQFPPAFGDPKEVAKLLSELASADAARRNAIARDSGIGRWLFSQIANGTQILANLVQISAEPHVHNIIARLLS